MDIGKPYHTNFLALSSYQARKMVQWTLNAARLNLHLKLQPMRKKAGGM